MQFQLVVANLNLLVVMERAQVDLQRMATKDSQMVKSKNLTPDLPCHVTFTQNYLLKKCIKKKRSKGLGLSFKCPKYHFYGKSLSFLMQPCCVPRGLFFVALGSSLRRNKGSWAWMLVAKGLATREHGDLWKPVSFVYFLGKFEKFSANFFGNHLKDQTELDNYNKR